MRVYRSARRPIVADTMCFTKTERDLLLICKRKIITKIFDLKKVNEEGAKDELTRRSYRLRPKSR